VMIEIQMVRLWLERLFLDEVVVVVELREE
jgi:hypothetical protein